MALPDPLVFNSFTHASVGPGRYIRTDSTMDQPIYLTLFSTPNRNPGSNSTYKVRWERHKNVVIAGVTNPEDDPLVIDLNIKNRARSYTDTEVQAAIINATVLFTNATDGLANLTKFLRGER